MEASQYLNPRYFLVSFFVITELIDSVLARRLGLGGMIVIGVMTDIDAFTMVDWNVIAILLFIWMISGYFSVDSGNMGSNA